MRNTLLIFAFAVNAMLAFAGEPAKDDKPAKPPEPKEAADVPKARDANWVKRHEGFVATAKKGDVDLLFLGDSITDGWDNKGKKFYDEHFVPLKVANFGISGDRTQHVLWRLQNGELEGIKPKLCVLMIGTNNTGARNTAPEIVTGIQAIVKELQARQPEMKILLLAVFPRGEKPDHPQRKQINEVNAEIAKLDDGKKVKYLDIGPKFLAADGTLPKDIMPDFLHPNEKGYEIWGMAIKDVVLEMMGKK